MENMVKTTTFLPLTDGTVARCKPGGLLCTTRIAIFVEMEALHSTFIAIELLFEHGTAPQCRLSSLLYSGDGVPSREKIT